MAAQVMTGYRTRIDPALGIGRACIYSLGSVWSRYEDEIASTVTRRHMFSGRRTSKRPRASSTRQKRPKVHVTSSGVFYVNVRELFESEVGQESLRRTERLAKRLGMEPVSEESESSAPDPVALAAKQD